MDQLMLSKLKGKIRSEMLVTFVFLKSDILINNGTAHTWYVELSYTSI